ncbi:MAG: c-type cytochrome [Thermoanaerobacterales bacterium]|nr:c-type cytochrome [Thermoanaerobacterales bacterium]
MTEIPEHLLKRSRERRAALGLGGDAPASAPAEAGEAEEAPAPAAAAPTPAPAAPAEVEKPKPPPPEPVYVQAAKRRKRIPYWAASVLVALPLWGYMYVRTLEPPPAGDSDPVAMGAEIYSGNCASCHGASGQGASGPALADGAVVETFPDWRDHAAWVRLGTDGWPAATYGATEKPVGGGGLMPAWPTLTDQELAQVVLYERQLSGEDVSEANEDYADLRAVALGEMTLAEAGLGELSEAAGVTEADLGG